MNQPGDLEKCLSFINCQLQERNQSAGGCRAPRGFRAITISRQACAGAHTIAARLAECLQNQEFDSSHPWTVFDRNLVEKVLEDHNLPARLARFMAEDRVSELADIMDELFGLHPSSWTLVRQTSETILHLAELGHVILIGRGANIVTRRLPDVLHVRLVGALPARSKRLAETTGISPREAVRQIEQEDLARERYVQQFFGKQIEDPLLYHLVLNTDQLSSEEIVRLITQTVAAPAWAAA